MRNFRSTLFLSVVVLGLLAYFFFIDRHQKGTAEREREETVLFGSSATDATALKITTADGAVVLDKKDGNWKIRQPIAADADPAAVAGVLRELSSLEARRVIQLSEIPHSDDTLQQWGLAPGNVRVEFSGPEFSNTLLIGRKTAINDLVYARASQAGREAEAPVTLVPADSGAAIGKKLSELRSRALLKGDLAKVSQLGIRIAPGTGTATAPVDYEIDRQGNDWKFQKPLAASADDKKVTAWLESLGKLRVKQFVSDDASNLSTYGLSSPASQFWVQSGDAKAPDTLLIGLPVPNTPGEVYAKRLAADAIVTVAAADVDRLLHDLPDARDRHVLAFDPDVVSAVRVEASRVGVPSKTDAKGRSEIVAVQKKEKEDAWTFDPATVPPVSGSADSGQLKTFLGALKNLEAAEIASDIASDLKPYGLDHPTATITLTKKGDSSGTVSLLIGRTEKAPAPAAPAATSAGAAPVAPTARFYAKNTEEPFIYALDAAFLDKLPKDSWSWLDSAATSTPPGQIKSLTVVPETGASFTVTRTDSGFQTDRVGVSVDPAKANAEITLAGNLRVLRWLGPPQPEWELAKPHWTVKATGDAPFTVVLGVELPEGGRAAQVVGQPFAFALSDADEAALVTVPFAESVRPVPSAPAVPASAPVPAP